MKRHIEGVCVLCLFLMLIIIHGCSGEEENWEDDAGRMYDENDKRFLLEFERHVSNIFEVADLQMHDVGDKLERVKAFEMFIEENDNKFEFSWGAVFKKESSLSLIVNAAYIRIYQHTDECDIVLDNFYKFQALAKTDYQVIDGLVKEVYDPEIDEELYEKKKKEDYETLFGAIGKPDCITCEMKGDPDWFPSGNCIKGSGE